MKTKEKKAVEEKLDKVVDYIASELDAIEEGFNKIIGEEEEG